MLFDETNNKTVVAIVYATTNKPFMADLSDVYNLSIKEEKYGI